MSSPTVVAEPYAKALFECALESDSLTDWQVFLRELKKAVQDETLSKWIESPEVDSAVVNLAFQDILNKQNCTTEQKRFVELLIENGRLGLCSDIGALFNERIDQHIKLMRFNIVSAVELNEKQKESFAQALKKRYQSEIKVTFGLDATLIGGVRIEQGDKVIDASLSRRFKDLENEILQ